MGWELEPRRRALGDKCSSGAVPSRGSSAVGVSKDDCTAVWEEGAFRKDGGRGLRFPFWIARVMALSFFLPVYRESMLAINLS
jgi:hypothetical protein